jgi:hypothetical protein
MNSSIKTLREEQKTIFVLASNDGTPNRICLQGTDAAYQQDKAAPLLLHFHILFIFGHFQSPS